ncbi:hypothetical protein [Proteiniphilum sp. UBA5384]|uniref:hypothetical protein n=1 Tax=Proteiniphilum sp. UBA5384 TaxID=1947279 RepID=UPI0025E13711|nr:hypothetical protein [Proteiniphilum sp. UBA5384]
MSWDIVLFNSRQKITSVDEVDNTQLEATDFCAAFESHFSQIIKDGDHREIKGEDFTIDYFIEEDKVSNKIVSLYGENGLFELVELAKKYNWQIFDTGNGQMIDLEKPTNHGYENFQGYLRHVLKK